MLDEMQSPENLVALVAPRDEKSLLMQRTEDSGLCQLWRLTNMLFRVQTGALGLRNVKNGGTSGDVYENTGGDDKLSTDETAFLQENAPMSHDLQKSVGLFGGNCTNHTLIGAKWRPNRTDTQVSVVGQFDVVAASLPRQMAASR
jgi:hypothetical protein